MISVPASNAPAAVAANIAGARCSLRFFPIVFVCVLLSIPASLSFSLTRFDALDLSSDSRLLFSAISGGDGAPRQSALCLSNLDTGSISQLTAWPEYIDLLEGGATVQVRNTLGAVRIPLRGGLPAPVKGFPSFATGASIPGGRSECMSASPDGKWILYVEPVSAAFGRLVLIQVSSGDRTLIANDIERPGAVFPATWSPDSRVFIYARSGQLFFNTVDIRSGVIVDERYRLIGDGKINSLRWGFSGDFFYLRGSAVYRVRTSDLFARSLYAGFLEVGNLAGRIPFEFDPNFDGFWVSPDASALLFSKGGRNLFYYPLGFDDFVKSPSTVLPYLMLPRFCAQIQVLWSQGGIVTVLASFPKGSTLPTQAFRLKTRSESATWVFDALTVPASATAALSPDGNQALVWGTSGIELYDYVNWKAIKTLSTAPCLSALWLGSAEVLLADQYRIERRTLDGKVSLVCLAGVDSFGFEKSGSRYIARAGEAWYATDGKTAWNPVEKVELRPASPASVNYRVYLEQQVSSNYENIPMVRNLKGVGTESLFPKANLSLDPVTVKASDSAIDLSLSKLFSHGARVGRREIALVFDLMDDAEGLPFVLDTLKRFDVKASFFLNGEFIRRHPEAARELSVSGQEIASLFFAPIDLSDARYKIDADFIKRGLARNEDDYFNATGKELALLWHPPFYNAASEIIGAAATAGYRTIGRDVDPMDWVTRIEGRRASSAYKSASELVNLVVEQKQPGSIVPIRLGLPSGGRDDYLFSRVDVLIDALIRSGYELVTVSELVEHAR